MAKGRPAKDFQQYLIPNRDTRISHQEYMRSPGTAFLRYCIEAKSSIDLCVRHLTNENQGFSKDASDSLQHLVISSLPAIMGHFETFERSLFAGMFDNTVFLQHFNVDNFFNLLKKQDINIVIDPIRLSAYRVIGTNSIGFLLADSLSGWHDPVKVNKYFNAFDLQFTAFGKDEVNKLNVLWQLRHSIVHTGGTLTYSDAQKVENLISFAGNQIAFENNFIFEVARKLHPLVYKTSIGLGSAFKAALRQNTTREEKAKIDEFFDVKSTVNSWLR